MQGGQHNDPCVRQVALEVCAHAAAALPDERQQLSGKETRLQWTLWDSGETCWAELCSRARTLGSREQHSINSWRRHTHTSPAHLLATWPRQPTTSMSHCSCGGHSASMCTWAQRNADRGGQRAREGEQAPLPSQVPQRLLTMAAALPRAARTTPSSALVEPKPCLASPACSSCGWTFPGSCSRAAGELPRGRGAPCGAAGHAGKVLLLLPTALRCSNMAPFHE